MKIFVNFSFQLYKAQVREVVDKAIFYLNDKNNLSSYLYYSF